MSYQSGSVDTISRAEIQGDPDDLVAIFPTQEFGVNFLLENNAWGLVRISREPVYIAMYVSGPVREIKYIGKVRDIVSVNDIGGDLKSSVKEYTSKIGGGTANKLVRIEKNSLYQLEEPIPFKNKHPQSLRYAKLRELRNATTTDDVL